MVVGSLSIDHHEIRILVLSRRSSPSGSLLNNRRETHRLHSTALRRSCRASNTSLSLLPHHPALSLSSFRPLIRRPRPVAVARFDLPPLCPYGSPFLWPFSRLLCFFLFFLPFSSFPFFVSPLSLCLLFSFFFSLLSPLLSLFFFLFSSFLVSFVLFCSLFFFNLSSSFFCSPLFSFLSPFVFFFFLFRSFFLSFFVSLSLSSFVSRSLFLLFSLLLSLSPLFLLLLWSLSLRCGLCRGHPPSLRVAPVLLLRVSSRPLPDRPRASPPPPPSPHPFSFPRRVRPLPASFPCRVPSRFSPAAASFSPCSPPSPFPPPPPPPTPTEHPTLAVFAPVVFSSVPPWHVPLPFPRCPACLPASSPSPPPASEWASRRISPNVTVDRVRPPVPTPACLPSPSPPVAALGVPVPPVACPFAPWPTPCLPCRPPHLPPPRGPACASPGSPPWACPVRPRGPARRACLPRSPLSRPPVAAWGPGPPHPWRARFAPVAPPRACLPHSPPRPARGRVRVPVPRGLPRSPPVPPPPLHSSPSPPARVRMASPGPPPVACPVLAPRAPRVHACLHSIHAPPCPPGRPGPPPVACPVRR
ncbi:hypothetical protein C7M84_015174 [Penaeus vannamei]|uniref:Uncharacterized protein n=1 Tax=Penaeus vannamei TaxID=6689 RepID=A0A423SRH4_PENVA|nr:hypothetical protein C7M84_015174 [Penaeus vannamei]